MKRWLAPTVRFVFAVTILIPVLWVLMTSLKSTAGIFASPWSLPNPPQWQNYERAWSENGIGNGLKNTSIVALATLVILLPIGAMAAYVFAKYPFRGSKVLFGTFLGGMMFPNFLVVVPLFALLKSIGLYDTKVGLVLVYVAYSLAFTVFVLTGFFQAIPNELAEAAMLDGCGHGQTFWRVMLPVVRPGLLVIAIFNAIGLWNEYSLALTLTSDTSNRTLPLAIADMAMKNNYESDFGALFAGLVIIMTPVLGMYWIFREKIQQTMLAGAVKG